MYTVQNYNGFESGISYSTVKYTRGVARVHCVVCTVLYCDIYLYMRMASLFILGDSPTTTIVVGINMSLLFVAMSSHCKIWLSVSVHVGFDVDYNI